MEFLFRVTKTDLSLNTLIREVIDTISVSVKHLTHAIPMVFIFSNILVVYDRVYDQEFIFLVPKSVD